VRSCIDIVDGHALPALPLVLCPSSLLAQTFTFSHVSALLSLCPSLSLPFSLSTFLSLPFSLC
jgi:hypothetical protein